jgi:hypothetical protein
MYRGRSDTLASTPSARSCLCLFKKYLYLVVLVQPGARQPGLLAGACEQAVELATVLAQGARGLAR